MNVPGRADGWVPILLTMLTVDTITMLEDVEVSYALLIIMIIK